MSFETILAEIDDGLMTITLNRPDRLNAWTYQMGAEMAQAIEQANADESVDAIVVTGAGRGFCAGADIQDVFSAQQKDDSANEKRPQMRDWIGTVRNAKPIVAAINGAAIGVGLTQILPMDYLVASEEAKLSLRFIKMGIVPELASSQFVTLRCGLGKSSELMLTGKTISGAEAARIGLVDQALPAAEVMASARAMAKDMGSNPQAALRVVKQLITRNAAEADLKLVQQREMEALQECYKSPEHKEAIAAFMEKREPDFRKARAAG